MAAIRSRNTKPEIKVRSALHKLGYRFRLHRSDLPGKPDIILSKHRMAIFVHGCFWHSHDCKYGNVIPQTRKEFWKKKRSDTIARDSRNVANLQKEGWRVFTVWECQTRASQELAVTVEQIRMSLRKSP
jgi:DNA mismatch endonuclease (patch repair protein)